MEKILSKAIVMIILISMILFGAKSVYANTINDVQPQGAGQLVKLKENSEKKLEDYEQEYGGKAYGIAAYILNAVRIYSIPLCFITIAIGGIYQVIGIRKMDERDKGFGMMVTSITVLVITQLLPLIYAIVVKGWRG